MRRVCVFCGASPGARPAYAEAARELARELVTRDMGRCRRRRGGPDGQLADAVLAEQGEIIGVIPRALVEKEIGHRGVNDLRVVGSMHQQRP